MPSTASNKLKRSCLYFFFHLMSILLGSYSFYTRFSFFPLIIIFFAVIYCMSDIYLTCRFLHIYFYIIIRNYIFNNNKIFFLAFFRFNCILSIMDILLWISTKSLYYPMEMELFHHIYIITYIHRIRWINQYEDLVERTIFTKWTDDNSKLKI